MDVEGRHIDEVFIGRDSDDIVAQTKDRVAAEMGWKGLILRGLSPLKFAQKAVELYNQSHQTSHLAPATTLEFLQLGESLGYVTELG